MYVLNNCKPQPFKILSYEMLLCFLFLANKKILLHLALSFWVETCTVPGHSSILWWKIMWMNRYLCLIFHHRYVFFSCVFVFYFLLFYLFSFYIICSICVSLVKVNKCIISFFGRPTLYLLICGHQSRNFRHQRPFVRSIIWSSYCNFNELFLAYVGDASSSR